MHYNISVFSCRHHVADARLAPLPRDAANGRAPATPPLPHVKSLRATGLMVALSGGLTLPAVSEAIAQSATPPSLAGTQPRAGTAGDAKLVKMAAYEVDADKDVGYQGGNTTSGSRLNTSLKDTAASILVVTQEFMNDFGLHSLEEITAGRQFAEADLGLAAEMKPGAAPSPPRLKQTGTPWLFGNVPPQVD